MASGASNRAPAFEIRPIPGEDLIRLDHELVGAVDAPDPPAHDFGRRCAAIASPNRPR
jgi:hypothetical protein